MKLVIGLVGEMSGGKATFIKLFKEIAQEKYSVGSETFSTILIETLNTWNLPLTRENIQNMAITMVNGYGEGTLTDAVYNRVKYRPEDIIILDGVRWISDPKMIKKFPNNLLVYITADIDLRYKRSKKRGEKQGESNTSFEQFKKQHEAKTEIYISEIGQKADYKITNNGTLKEYKEKIEVFFKEKITKILNTD
jgi:uridine kinase